MTSIKDGRMNVTDAAAYLGVNTQSIRAMARKNKIGFIQIGRSYFFTKEDLNRAVKIGTPQNASTDIS